jgi:ketosteroid isomerase-like protein
MGAAENKQLIQSMFAELSRGNGAGYLDGLADDVRFTIMGTTKYSGTFHGKQDVVNRLLTPLMSELEGGLEVTPDAFIAEGDTVVMQGRGRSKTKTGKPYNNSYCQVFRIAGGKVKEITEYLDTELVTQAFGK